MRSRVLQFAARRLAVFCLALLAPFGIPPQGSDDLRYLLVRRAGTPEKNYYEFARRLAGILDADLEFHGLLDVITEDPGGIRYGVYRIYRSRVLVETDSEQQPASEAEGAFVLIYRRDPDLKFCAKSYRFEREPSGARKITYTDFVDGREYSFHMAKNWPRPFSIYVVRVFPSDLLHDVWQRFHQKQRQSSTEHIGDGEISAGLESGDGPVTAGPDDHGHALAIEYDSTSQAMKPPFRTGLAGGHAGL